MCLNNALRIAYRAITASQTCARCMTTYRDEHSTFQRPRRRRGRDVIVVITSRFFGPRGQTGTNRRARGREIRRRGEYAKFPFSGEIFLSALKFGSFVSYAALYCYTRLHLRTVRAVNPRVNREKDFRRACAPFTITTNRRRTLHVGLGDGTMYYIIIIIMLYIVI